MASDLSARERLELIVRALRFCGQTVDREALRVQFRQETGKEAPREDLDAALRSLARRPNEILRAAFANTVELLKNSEVDR